MFRRLIASIVCLTFSFSNLQYVHAQDFSINQLPVPGTMVGESAPFSPLALKGLIVNPQKPLEFQFIIDTGKGPQDTASIKDQANQLVRYFLAGLTIPEGDLWVNLSPYEKNRMVPEALGQTDLGRDLLAQDYILKQLTASLIYPEKDLGKEFWSRVYAKAQQQFGTTNVPVNTFNKVWILPDQAQVYENVNAAYVTKSTLKVMLDEDYTALQKHTTVRNGTDSIGSQIVRQIILPEIEKEVNTGKNFAPLRQIYQALILAKWYKETIQNGLLDAVYTNKNKIAGVNLKDPAVKEQIYEHYLKAYKKGAFNYIKEDPTPDDGQVVPRKYFSGGTFLGKIPLGRSHNSKAMLSWRRLVAGALLLLTVGLGAPVLAQSKTPLLRDSMYRSVGLSSLLTPLNLKTSPEASAASEEVQFIERHPMFTAGLTTAEVDAAMSTGTFLRKAAGYLIFFGISMPAALVAAYGMITGIGSAFGADGPYTSFISNNPVEEGIAIAFIGRSVGMMSGVASGFLIWGWDKDSAMSTPNHTLNKDAAMGVINERTELNSLSNGETYEIPVLRWTQNNLFTLTAFIGNLIMKIPSNTGQIDFQAYVKYEEADHEAIRSNEPLERFSNLNEALKLFPEFNRVRAVFGDDFAYYLVVHRLQYERLKKQNFVGIPETKFVVTKVWNGGKEFNAPAIIQKNISGIPLSSMIQRKGFLGFVIRRSFDPKFSHLKEALRQQLQSLMDSDLSKHIDWSIDNFIWNDSENKLYYVDSKVTTIASKSTVTHNYDLLRQDFVNSAMLNPTPKQQDAAMFGQSYLQGLSTLLALPFSKWKITEWYQSLSTGQQIALWATGATAVLTAYAFYRRSIKWIIFSLKLNPKIKQEVYKNLEALIKVFTENFYIKKTRNYGSDIDGYGTHYTINHTFSEENFYGNQSFEHLGLHDSNETLSHNHYSPRYRSISYFPGGRKLNEQKLFSFFRTLTSENYKERIQKVLNQTPNAAMILKNIYITLEDLPIETGSDFGYVQPLPVGFEDALKKSFGNKIVFQSWVWGNDQGKTVGHTRLIAPMTMQNDIVGLLKQYKLGFFIQKMLPKTDIFYTGQKQMIHYAGAMQLEYTTVNGRDKTVTIQKKDGKYYQEIDGIEKEITRTNFGIGDDPHNPVIEGYLNHDWFTFTNIRSLKPISISYEIPEKEALDQGTSQTPDQNAAMLDQIPALVFASSMPDNVVVNEVMQWVQAHPFLTFAVVPGVFLGGGLLWENYTISGNISLFLHTNSSVYRDRLLRMGKNAVPKLEARVKDLEGRRRISEIEDQDYENSVTRDFINMRIDGRTLSDKLNNSEGAHLRRFFDARINALKEVINEINKNDQAMSHTQIQKPTPNAAMLGLRWIIFRYRGDKLESKLKEYLARQNYKTLVDIMTRWSFGDNFYLVRAEAAESLGNLGDKRAIPPLIKVIDEEHYYQTNALTLGAGKALFQLGDVRGLEPLLYAVNNGIWTQIAGEKILETGRYEHADIIAKLLNWIRQHPSLDYQINGFFKIAVIYKKQGYDFDLPISQVPSYEDITETHRPGSGLPDIVEVVGRKKIGTHEQVSIVRGEKLNNAMSTPNIKPDSAMLETSKAISIAEKGGIDLNQINVKRNGKTVSVHFDPAQLSALTQGGFEGFSFKIESMIRISSPFQLLGINAPEKRVMLAKA